MLGDTSASVVSTTTPQIKHSIPHRLLLPNLRMSSSHVSNPLFFALNIATVVRANVIVTFGEFFIVILHHLVPYFFFCKESDLAVQDLDDVNDPVSVLVCLN